MEMKALVLCFTAMTLAFASSPSSENAQSQTSLTATTRAVVLDVVVRDRHGNRVQGLTKADFKVVEDDQPQTIVSFEETETSAGPATALADAAQQIILLDEMNSGFADVAYVRHCLAKLLGGNGGELRQPTALIALTNDGLRLLHKSTYNGNSLMDALNAHRTALPWRQQGGLYREMERIDLSLGALHQIAQAAAGSRVRRNLIWISPGFPLSSTLQFSDKSRDHLFEGIRLVSSELLHARIAVYTIDPRVTPTSVGEMYISRQGLDNHITVLANIGRVDFQDLALARFAQETGGRSFWGRNDIDAEVAESATEGASYYTISYYPNDRNFDGKFRKLKVLVNRPSLEVRTRAGYFAMPEPSPLSEKQTNQQLERALSNPLQYVAIPTKAEFTALLGKPSNARLNVEIDRRALTWTSTDDGAFQYDLLAGTAAFDEKGRVKSIKAYSFTGKVPREIAADRSRKTIVLNLVTPVDPETRRIRVVVRDLRTGEMGSSETGVPAVTDHP